MQGIKLVKFGCSTISGWKVIKIFVFHRKCIGSAPKLGFLGILGVKTEICIFLNPKRHLLASKHAFWRITRPNRFKTVTCGGFQEKKTKRKRTSKTTMEGCAGEVVYEPIPMKFGTIVDQDDVMKCAKFHRPRSLPFGNILVQSWRF